jgi:hypothetical protein
VWQKSNETDFLLNMNFILFTNQGYPLQNSFLGQLHSDGDVVSVVRSSRVRFCYGRDLRWKYIDFVVLGIIYIKRDNGIVCLKSGSSLAGQEILLV